MDRNLDRIGVYQKNNFKTLLSKIDRALESRFKNDQTEIQKIRDEISINIFKILNRSGHKRYKRDTSALTAMYGSWVSKMLDNITGLKHQSIKYICSHEVFKSITGMQATQILGASILLIVIGVLSRSNSKNSDHSSSVMAS